MPGPRSDDFADRLPPGQGEPKSPGDFSIDNVGVRRGECRDEVGRDIAENGLFASCVDGRLWLRKVLRRAELYVLSYLELGAGVVLRTCCVRGDLGQVGVTGKHISVYSWRQVDDEVTGE